MTDVREGRDLLDRARLFMLYGNVLEGLIAVGFVSSTYALLRLRPDLPLLVLAFCGTFLVYQFERGLRPAPEDAFNQPRRLAWVRRHRAYVWISSAVAAAAAAFMLPFLRSATLIVCAVLGLAGLFYVVPLPTSNRRLKSIWFLKPLLISGAWAVGGVIVPLLEGGASVTAAAAGLLGYRFLFVLPNALLADWPDRMGDARAGLHTVATRWSVDHLKWTAAAPLLLAVVGALAAGMLVDLPPLLYVDLVGPVLMLGAVLRLFPQAAPRLALTLDAIVGWPVVTSALYLLMQAGT